MSQEAISLSYLRPLSVSIDYDTSGTRFTFTEDSLPVVEEAIEKLKNVNQLNKWMDVAILYYSAEKQKLSPKLSSSFLRILHESSRHVQNPSDLENVRRLDKYAEYNLMTWIRTNKNKEYFFKQIFDNYNEADQIAMFERDHVLSSATSALIIEDSCKFEHTVSRFEYIDGTSTAANNEDFLLQLGLGTICYRKSDYHKAFMHFQNALKAGHTLAGPKLRVAMGNCLLKLGRVKHAILAYERALEMDPECIDVLINLAVALLLRKSKTSGQERAYELLEKAFILEPNNPITLLHLADMMYVAGKFEMAAQFSEHLDGTEALFQYGRAQLALGNVEKAEENLLEASKDVSAGDRASLCLARIYLKQGRLEESISHLEAFYKKNRTPEMRRLIALVYASSDQRIAFAHATLKELISNKDSYDVEIEEAFGRLRSSKNGSLKDSRIHYGNVLRMAPKVHPATYIELAAIQWQEKLYNEAALSYQKALEIVEKDGGLDDQQIFSLKYNAARCLQAVSHPSIDDVYKSLLDQCPSFSEIHIRMGEVAEMRGNIHEASDHYKMATVDPETSTDAWLSLGHMHYRIGEYGPAQKKYEKALEQSPNDVMARLSLANTWMKTLADRSVPIDRRQRHSERAEELYRSVLRDEPGCFSAAIGIACILIYHDRYQLAKSILKDVFSAAKFECANVLLNLAVLSAKMENFASAVCNFSWYFRNENQPSLNTSQERYVNVQYAASLLNNDEIEDGIKLIRRLHEENPSERKLSFMFALMLEIAGLHSIKIHENKKALLEQSIEGVKESKHIFEKLRQEESNGNANRIKALEFEKIRCAEIMVLLHSKLTQAKLHEEKKMEVRRAYIEGVKKRLAEAAAEKAEEERKAELRKAACKAARLQWFYLDFDEKSIRKRQRQARKDYEAANAKKARRTAETAETDEDEPFSDTQEEKGRRGRRQKSEEDDQHVQASSRRMKGSKRTVTATKRKSRPFIVQDSEEDDDDDDDDDDSTIKNERRATKKAKQAPKPTPVAKAFKSKAYISTSSSNDECGNETEEQINEEDERQSTASTTTSKRKQRKMVISDNEEE